MEQKRYVNAHPTGIQNGEKNTIMTSHFMSGLLLIYIVSFFHHEKWIMIEKTISSSTNRETFKKFSPFKI